MAHKSSRNGKTRKTGRTLLPPNPPKHKPEFSNHIPERLWYITPGKKLIYRGRIDPMLTAAYGYSVAAMDQKPA